MTRMSKEEQEQERIVTEIRFDKLILMAWNLDAQMARQGKTSRTSGYSTKSCTPSISPREQKAINTIKRELHYSVQDQFQADCEKFIGDPEKMNCMLRWYKQHHM